MKKTPIDIQNFKNADMPMVCLTAYTARIAALLDQYCDLLLVGDSLAMVLYGMENTRGVDLDMMINHGKAVAKGAQQACVVVDMPFGTYEDSAEQALKNAQRVMDETGCDAVKLEGGANLAPIVQALTQAGIPVVGHIGLMPQSVTQASGFRVQGQDEDAKAAIMRDAKAIENAGAFAIVIEATMEPLAEEITQSIGIPSIGIGASPACDGQILVTEDMLGITGDKVPKFVKQYAHVSADIERAVAGYAGDVRSRAFPGEAQLYKKKAS